MTAGEGQISKVNESDMFRIGPTETVYLPDGFIVTIRERNGDDEDILSKVKDNKDNTAINNFLASIITEPKLTPKQIGEMKIKNKYYLLFRSRMQSLGAKVVFKHTFTGDEDKTKEAFFDEDLPNWDWDFSKPYIDFPFKPENPGYFKYKCKPYPDGTREQDMFESSTTSGKKYRMKYLTGDGETKTLKKQQNELSINDKLRVRDFQIQMSSGAWQTIERFNMLSSRDMAEIRTKLEEMDSPFDLMVETVNPLTGSQEFISMFLKEDFFFPLTQ